MESERDLETRIDLTGALERPRLPIEEILQALETLVAEQEQESLSGQFLPIRAETRKGIFAGYKATELFSQRYKEAINILAMPLDEEGFGEFMSNLVGGVYQDIAYLSLAGRQPEGRSLLSPQRTLNFYQTLYPQAPESSYPFGLDSLLGISVPDGLFVGKNNGRIEATCGYTLSGKPEGVRDAIHHLQIAREDFPLIINPDCQIIFVVPQDSYLLIKDGRKNIQFIPLPFTHHQFRNFIDGIYNHYTPEGSVTLAEIQAEANYQYARTLGKLCDNLLRDRPTPLTPEAEAYLEKCWSR